MDDLISRQAAIDALHMHLMYRMGTDSNKKRLDDWINGLPSAQETHEERTETHACDLIDRQAALDAIMGQPPEPHYPSWYAAQIEKLPAAQPATNCSEIPNGSDDTISRQMALDALE